MSTPLSPDVFSHAQRAQMADLLEAIAGPWLATGEAPIWGHVQHFFDQRRINADDRLQSLPRVGVGTPFGAGYGYTTFVRPPIGEGDRVRLTVAASLVLPAVRMVVGEPFLRVLHHMIKLYADKPVSTNTVTSAKLRSRELAAAMPHLKPAFIKLLPDLLSYEPAIGNGGGVQLGDGSWERDITRSVLRFRDVKSIADYVTKTCEIVTENAAQFGPVVVEAPVAAAPERAPYVDLGLLDELGKEDATTAWSLHKLIALCRELNDNYVAGNPYACAALIRAVLDHIPPVFGHKDFRQVAAQHAFSIQRTDKVHAQNLAAFKGIADDALHRPIGATVPVLGMDDLPAPTRLRSVLHELLTILRRDAAAT
ncbi:hypothetical protein [Streptomyces sp. NPDC056982]|uniref:hypothetical protein n=1 Tax=Streptomyces sp. NPDC056982 TaxID=3345986 RepID=UPI00362E4E33